jgi:signal transduction histidine kinase
MDDTKSSQELTKMRSDDALWRVQQMVLNTLNFNEVVQKVVDALLLELNYLRLGYKIVVLALKDDKMQFLKRVSISNTEEAQKAIEASPVPFREINIPYSAENNLLIKVLRTKNAAATTYWPDILCPAFTQEEAIEVQKIVGIQASLVYPLITKNEAIGVMIFSLSKNLQDITEPEKYLIERFTGVVGLAVQNSQLYSSLEETKNNLEKANSQLRELDHLKDEFLNFSAHELRTPLTAVQGYANLLQMENERSGTFTPHQLHYVHNIVEAAGRVIKLVNTMLNISRMKAGKFEITLKPTDLWQLVQSVLQEVLPLAQQHELTLSVQQSPSPLPPVLADGDWVKEVLINIIGNAIKFTPAGGSITITFLAQQDMVVTSVTDTGRGVKPDEMQFLFQEYGMLQKNAFLRQEQQGSGLGLYFSRSLIRLHGGEMTLTSPGENKGSTVSFSLKLAPPSP